MAKVTLKVSSVQDRPEKKFNVIAHNDVMSVKLFDADGKELTEAQAKKLKPAEVKRRRVKTADRVGLSFETSNKYSVGDDITITL